MKKFRVVLSKSKSKEIVTIDNFISLSFSCLDRANVYDTINWGLFCNSGNLKFVLPPNKESFIKDAIQKNEKTIAEIYMDFYDDSALTYSEKLAYFNVVTPKYYAETREVEIELEDPLMNLQKKEREKGILNLSGVSLENLLKNVLYKSPTDELTPLSKPILEMETLADDDLSITVQVARLKKATYFSLINEILQAGLTRGYTSNKGKLSVSSEWFKKNSKPIIINPKSIISVKEEHGKYETAIPNAKLSLKKYKVTINGRTKYSARFNWWTHSSYFVDGKEHWNIIWDGYGDLTSKPEHFVPNNPSSTLSNSVTEGKFNVGDEVEIFRDTQYVATISVDTNKFTLGQYKSVVTENDEVSRENEYFDQNTNEFHFKFRKEKSRDLFLDEYYIKDGKVTLLANFYETLPNETTSYETLEGEKYVEIPANDLMQVGNETNDGLMTYQERIIKTVNSKYSEGITCVVIECLLSEFYDTEGSSYKLLTRGNIVCPYVVRNGITQPYSTDYRGYPITFKVIGVSYIYDGLPRNELSLQEYSSVDYGSYFYLNYGSKTEKYIFYEGMTFGDWLKSSYNKIGLRMNGTRINTEDGGFELDDATVYTKIKNGDTYYFISTVSLLDELI